MPAFCFEKSIIAVAAGLALAILVAPGAGLAYTAEQQQACTPDAMRLCGEFIPNVDAITACMIQRKAQLSPQCRAYFRPAPEREEEVAPPTNIRPHVVKRSVRAKTIRKKRRSEED